jgi:predicted GIY-YIG superfamily endonuclease
VAAAFDKDCQFAKRHKLRKPARPACLDDYEVAWEEGTDIPEAWVVVPLGKACSKVTDGTHNTPKPTPSGIPYITAKHIRERRIDFANSLFLAQADHDEIFARCNPQRGDVLIVNIGAGTATPAMVRVDFEFSLKNVALLKPIKGLLLGEYLELYQLLMKPRVFDEVTRGGAQPFMGLDLIKTIPFRLPPFAEQQEIAYRVEGLFALADQIEARYAKAKAHVEKLTQSILAKAFRGELVPQDPNDLPAPRPGVWFVYVLECADGSHYIGHTDDVEKRWCEHAGGRGSDWCRAHPPVSLAYWEQLDSREAAVRREKDLKTGFGRNWLKREIAAGRTRQAGEPASVLLERIRQQRDDNKSNTVTIRWKRASLSDRKVGHGFCVYARSDGRRESLVAFVEGFAWFHGGNKAIVRFDPKFMPIEKQTLATFKTAVEARIRSRNVSESQVMPGYWGVANA